MRAIFILLYFWSAVSSAASLTICGIADGGPGDSDGVANGSITATCSSAGGSFTGTFGERADPQNYTAGIRGVFSGTGGFNVSGQYTLFGSGDFYPFIGAGGGTLNGPAGALAPSGAFLTMDGSVFAGPAFSGVVPVPVIRGSNPYPQQRTFAGPNSFNMEIAWSAGGPDFYFDFSTSGGPVIFASTAPDHIIPEPSTLALAGIALAGCWLVRKRSIV